MRNFEERMDEIRRRSARILEEKKRRKRLLLACVPVLVCGILLTGVLAMQPGNKPAPEISMEAAPEFELLQDNVILSCVELSPDEVEGENEPPANQTGVGICGDSFMYELDDGDISASLSEQVPSSYSFKALSDSGVVTYYKLEGNLLTNTLTGQARELTQAQLEALLQLLEERGITP